MTALAWPPAVVPSRVARVSEAKPATPPLQLPRHLARLVEARERDGLSMNEIAAKMGISRQKVVGLFMKARKLGWVAEDDQIVAVMQSAALDAANKHLMFEGTPMGVMQGRSVMTRATLAGTGIFKTHSAIKQESKNETTNILRVEISLPALPEGAQAAVIEGVLASPRRALIGEVIDAV